MMQLDRRRLMQCLGLAPAAAIPRAPTVPAPAPRLPAKLARPALRLLVTRINGERYDDAEAAFANLAIGAPVTLRREPDAAYDRRASVLDTAGRKLGTIARIDNSEVACMIDAGERFEARVARLTPPLDIRVTVDRVRG